MILVRPSVEILTMTENPLQLIELAGRTCYKSESPLTEDTAKEFCRMLTRKQHRSVIEHAVATVRFVCDRGVSHEIVRHRLCSYSQESTRYVDYTKSSQGGHCKFVIPPWLSLQAGECDPDQTNIPDPGTRLWLYGAAAAERSYRDLRTLGWSPQKARGLLPHITKTEVVMTTNFRNWQHFFRLRACSPAAHPQMREVAIPLLRMFQRRVPVLFSGLHICDAAAFVR